MNGPQQNSPRRRLQALLAIPDSQRTDAEWDELNELEIMLAPGNRIGPSEPGGGRRSGGSQQGAGGQHAGNQNGGAGTQGKPAGGAPAKKPARNKFPKRAPKPKTPSGGAAPAA